MKQTQKIEIVAGRTLNSIETIISKAIQNSNIPEKDYIFIIVVVNGYIVN